MAVFAAPPPPRTKEYNVSKPVIKQSSPDNANSSTPLSGSDRQRSSPEISIPDSSATLSNHMPSSSLISDPSGSSSPRVPDVVSKSGHSHQHLNGSHSAREKCENVHSETNDDGDDGDELSPTDVQSTVMESSDDENEDCLQVIHIEVRLRQHCTSPSVQVIQPISSWLQEQGLPLVIGAEVTKNRWEDVDWFKNRIERIKVAECDEQDNGTVVGIRDAQLIIHPYKLFMDDLEEFGAGGDDESINEHGEPVTAATVRKLPSMELEGVWENLFYSEPIKSKLLDFITSILYFSDVDIDPNIISVNRLILLHGPPGTGKTSLCRALAQKLAIRLSDRYSHGQLVEINSHSLFSKWFSESGKLVQNLFSKITEMVEDESCFVVVMIDEVESITVARAGSMSGSEPNDSMRVVNALLTQLDKLKTRKNVLVMATSNMSEAIDPAFIDRADIKQYVGLPPPQAIYWILASCLSELMVKGVIKPSMLLSWNEVKAQRLCDSLSNKAKEKERLVSMALKKVAIDCEGISGRMLRRLPVLAHARYLARSYTIFEAQPRSSKRWIEAIQKILVEEKEKQDFVYTRER